MKKKIINGSAEGKYQPDASVFSRLCGSVESIELEKLLDELELSHPTVIADYRQAELLSAPKGFDPKIWKEMDKTSRATVHSYMEKFNIVITESFCSKFKKFFYSTDSLPDPEPGINALILILVLMLTIPFSTASLFNHDFFIVFKNQYFRILLDYKISQK